MSRSPRPGFAATFALFLVALVGAAMLAVTTLMATDARRSTRAAVDAQLRQLLHAGAVTAAQWVEARGVEARDLPSGIIDVPLPDNLADDDAVLNIQFHPSDDPHVVRAAVHAAYLDRTAQQTLVLANGAAGWRVVSAALD